MNKRIGLLGGLLAVQLLIIAGILFNDSLYSPPEAVRLLSFDPAEVTEFSIFDQDGAVALSRTLDEGDSSGWRLEDGLPADGGKVQEVLNKLTELAVAWPVATSSDSARRFEVTEETHQRRLTIASDDGMMTGLFLGTSPGYRRVHVRIDGESEVYSIDFSNYEAPTDADQWLDKSLLASPGEPTSIALEGAWRLSRGEEDQWLVDEVVADAEAADRLVRRFTGLRVLGVSSEVGEPKGLFVVNDDRGEHRLTLFHAAEDDNYSIASSRLDGRFEMAAYTAEQLLIETSDLLPSAEDDGPAPSEDAAAEIENIQGQGGQTLPGASP